MSPSTLEGAVPYDDFIAP